MKPQISATKDKDIHALKLASLSSTIDDMFYELRLLDQSAGSTVSLPCSLFSAAVLENADFVKVRSNKANKIATKAPEEGSSADARWQAGRIL